MYTIYNKAKSISKVADTLDAAEKLQSILAFAFGVEFMIAKHKDVWAITNSI